jgi:exodeoxyribonuclease VII large subunit
MTKKKPSSDENIEKPEQLSLLNFEKPVEVKKNQIKPEKKVKSKKVEKPSTESLEIEKPLSNLKTNLNSDKNSVVYQLVKPKPQSDDNPYESRVEKIGPKIYSVTELVNNINSSLKKPFSNIWVEGEIVDVYPRNRVYYFIIKDEGSRIESILFTWSFKPDFPMKNGLKVRARGSVGVYSKNGKLSFQVEFMEPIGKGALALAFEKLKRKLQEEGLFDQKHKKPLPEYPQKVAIITSPAGAAVRDVLKVAQKRLGTHIIIIPTLVQGEKAPEKIVNSIRKAKKLKGVDLIIITRGGGSIEDLACFNSEEVVREVFSCDIPIVSGVGHQTDFTLIDFVSDKRAATPTEAAEIVFVELNLLKNRLDLFQSKMIRAITYYLESRKTRIFELSSRLVNPKTHLAKIHREIDQYGMRIERIIQNILKDKNRKLEILKTGLLEKDPGKILTEYEYKINKIKQKIENLILIVLNEKLNKLEILGSKLNAMNPMLVLQRGYAIVTTQNNEVLSDSGNIEINEDVNIELSKGKLVARILKK